MNKLCKFIIIIMIMTSTCFADDKVNKVKEFIEELGREVIQIVANNSEDLNRKTAELSSLFFQTIDVKWIGKFAMGRYYKELSPEQQIKYDSLFSQYLLNSYLPYFMKYTQETMQIVNVSNHSANEYLVQTEIIRINKEAFKVQYMVRFNENGSYSIFDIIVEGVSLINTKRSEFNSIISSSRVDNLIALLQKKINNHQ